MNQNELTVYDRISDPLAFIEKMGAVFFQSRACGATNESQGKLIALACLAEKMNPFELAKQYHLIDGKLSMRSDAMLANYRAAGGTHRWLNWGDDGEQAVAEFSKGKDTSTVTYSIKDAQRAGLVKAGGAWVKDPGAMLRARCISKAIRGLCPEIVAGVYTPEELDDVRDNGQSESFTRQSTPAQISRETVQSLPSVNSVFVPVPEAPQVEAEPEPAPFEADSVPESESEPESEPESTALTGKMTDEQYIQLSSLCDELGQNIVDLESSIKAAGANITTIHDLTAEQATRLAANMTAQLASKN